MSWTDALKDLKEYLAELKHDKLMEEHELFTTLSSQGYLNYGSMSKDNYRSAEYIFKAALKSVGEVI
jgi:hypothetical protein